MPRCKQRGIRFVLSKTRVRFQGIYSASGSGCSGLFPPSRVGYLLYFRPQGAGHPVCFRSWGWGRVSCPGGSTVRSKQSFAGILIVMYHRDASMRPLYSF